MILEQSVVVAAPPERIWNFFRRMDENYTRWHPDHIDFRWLGPGNLAVGNGFYFEERIHGQHLKRTVHFTEIVPNRLIAFRPDNRFVRLFLPRIAFEIARDGAGCRFTQTIRVRIGPIGWRLNKKGFAAVEKHMREEGENLKATQREEVELALVSRPEAKQQTVAGLSAIIYDISLKAAGKFPQNQQFTESRSATFLPVVFSPACISRYPMHCPLQKRPGKPPPRLRAGERTAGNEARKHQRCSWRNAPV